MIKSGYFRKTLKSYISKMSIKYLGKVSTNLQLIKKLMDPYGNSTTILIKIMSLKWNGG